MLALIPQSIKSAVFWSSLGWVDILLFIVFFVGVILGVKKGLAQVLPNLIEVMVAQIVVIEYTAKLTSFASSRFGIPNWPIQIIIFASLAIISIFVIRFFFKALSLIATVDFKQPLNNLGGAFMNGLTLVLFLSLVSEFIMLFNIPFIQESLTQKSLSGPYLIQVCEQVHYFFERWIPASLRI